ncbi:Cerato-platanin, partial [Melanogaster broomeanus]
LALFSALPVFAQATDTTLSYDPNYDNAGLDLSQVACSTGTYGLQTEGYTTLGSLPSFPNVGAVYTVEAYDSPQCGACYAVTYGATVVNILAVDVSKNGFTVSEQAMNALTGNQAEQFGRVAVTFEPASPDAC